jgi:hypothetical protein
MSRFDTLFSLRYAVRVLERQARFWRHVDGALRLVTIISGSAAFAAMLTQQAASVSVGVLLAFAVLQAVEFSVQPGLRAAEAWVARAPYLALLSAQHEMDDRELEAAYHDACQRDTVQAFESLRRVAYNDVVEEKGCDAAAAYHLSRWQSVMQLIA